MTTTAAAAVVAGDRFSLAAGGGGPPPPEVDLVSLYALSGGSAVDSISAVNGTNQGSWHSFAADSIVAGVAGTSYYKTGGTGHITLPAAQAAHDLSSGVSISFYVQPSGSLNKHIYLSWGDGTQIGDGSIERLTNGRIRAWHVGGDGGLRFFESTDGVAGTNLVEGTAYRITVILGAPAARLYIDDAEVASIPQNTNGWNNSRVKYVGTWTDGVLAPMQGIIKYIRIWNGPLLVSGVTLLEDAQSVTPPTLATDLPYRGLGYGVAMYGQIHGNNRMRATATPGGESFFFYAERSGTVTGLQFHTRIGDGYSVPITPGAAAGSYGTYTVQIRPANSTTRRPTAAAPICQLTGWQAPGGSSGNYPTITFSTTGALVAGQPYCIVLIRTNTNGYFSENIFCCASHMALPTDSWYTEPGRGNAGDSRYVVESASNTIEPQNVGATIARVRGWSPHVVGGVAQFPGAVATEDGVLKFRNGWPEIGLIYSDGGVSGWGAWGGEGGTDDTFPGGAAYRIRVGGAVQIRYRFRVTRQSLVTPGIFLHGCRTNAATDDLIMTLEDGPTTDNHFPASNGTPFETINVPSNMFLNVGTSLNNVGPGTPWELPHWVYVPWSTPRTLALGSQYTLRIRGTGSASVDFQSSSRADNIGHSVRGRTLTWAQWEAQREVSREAFEDCRDGPEYSSNSGSTWTGTLGFLPTGIWFKRTV